jgi:hypothetical protein
MKEFEKLWDKLCESPSFPRVTARKPCEKVWRTALEWIKTIGHRDFDEYNSPTGDYLVDELDIEEELNDEKY